MCNKKIILVMAAALASMLMQAQNEEERAVNFYMAHYGEIAKMWQARQGTDEAFRTGIPTHWTLVDVDGDGCLELWLRSNDGSEQAMLASGGEQRVQEVARASSAEQLSLEGNAVVVTRILDRGSLSKNYAVLRQSAVEERLTDLMTERTPGMLPMEYDHTYSYPGVDDPKKAAKAAKKLLKAIGKARVTREQPMAWRRMGDLGLYWTNNMTRRERPVMAHANFRENAYVYTAGDKTFDPQKYAYLVFKQNVGEVELVSQSPDSAGAARAYCYRLKNKKAAKKMFKGYTDHEVMPVLMTAACRKSHELIKFSKWKSGEPKRVMTAEERARVESCYDRGVVSNQWMAGFKDGKDMMDLWAVWFDGAQISPLTALVLTRNGVVEATFNHHGTPEHSRNYVEHLPSLQCIAKAQDAPVELYIHHEFPGRSEDYILVQAGNIFVTVGSDSAE